MATESMWDVQKWTRIYDVVRYGKTEMVLGIPSGDVFGLHLAVNIREG